MLGQNHKVSADKTHRPTQADARRPEGQRHREIQLDYVGTEAQIRRTDKVRQQEAVEERRKEEDRPRRRGCPSEGEDGGVPETAGPGKGRLRKIPRRRTRENRSRAERTWNGRDDDHPRRAGGAESWRHASEAGAARQQTTASASEEIRIVRREKENSGRRDLKSKRIPYGKGNALPSLKSTG